MKNYTLPWNAIERCVHLYFLLHNKYIGALWEENNAENHRFKCATDRQKSINSLDIY